MEILTNKSIFGNIKSYTIRMDENEHFAFQAKLIENGWKIQDVGSLFSSITSLSWHEFKNGNELIKLEADDWFYYYEIPFNIFKRIKIFLPAS